jgi:hypothetical protein
LVAPGKKIANCVRWATGSAPDTPYTPLAVDKEKKMMRAIVVAAVVLLSGCNGYLASGFADGFSRTYAATHGYEVPPPQQHITCHTYGMTTRCDTY